MPQTIRMPDGTLIHNVPDDYVLPERLQGDPGAQFGDEIGSVMTGLLEARKFIVDRLPDQLATGALRPTPEAAMDAAGQANPVGAAVGESFFPVAAGLAAPGRIVAQAGVAAGLEALKGSDTSLEEIGRQGFTAGAFTGVGNMATRVLSGGARAYQAARGGQVLKTTSPSARMLSEMGVGRGLVDDINQRALKLRLGKVLGIQNMKNLGPAELQQAAKNFDAGYKRILTLTDNIDTRNVKAAIEALDVNFPGRKALLSQVEKLNGTTNSNGLRGLHRSIRDTAAKFRRDPNLASWSDEFAKVGKELDSAAQAAGVNADELGKISQRYKVFKTIEETPDAWIGGRLNPRQLVGKLGRDNFKGFGSTVKRGQTGKLAPDVGGFIDDIAMLADDGVRMGQSGTAPRLIQGGGALGGATGLATGVIDPTTAAAGLLGYAVLPPGAAAYSVGESVDFLGRLASAGRLAIDDE